MGFLRLLESIRFPAMDSIMSVITYAGDEIAFMAIALLVFWCVSKRCGYYIFLVDFVGTVIVQIAKLLFRVPRPWVLDPSFTIVEAAREGASDYSFPSGHTMNAVGMLGALAVSGDRRWLRWVCGCLIVLVPFSRMYLGVHTPLDVGAAFLIAALLVVIFRPMFASEEKFGKNAVYALNLMAVFAVILIVFVLFWRFPADINADYLAAGVKNAFTIGGAVLGLIAVYYYDSRVLKFDTKAPLLGQILKYVLGMAILVGLKAGLKALLISMGLTSPIQNSIRYFIMVVFAGCIWPMTFPAFAKIGKRKNTSASDGTPAEAPAADAAKKAADKTQEDAQ